MFAISSIAQGNFFTMSFFAIVFYSAMAIIACAFPLSSKISQSMVVVPYSPAFVKCLVLLLQVIKLVCIPRLCLVMVAVVALSLSSSFSRFCLPCFQAISPHVCCNCRARSSADACVSSSVVSSYFLRVSTFLRYPFVRSPLSFFSIASVCSCLPDGLIFIVVCCRNLELLDMLTEPLGPDNKPPDALTRTVPGLSCCLCRNCCAQLRRGCIVLCC